jgi:hypothetical protein
MGADRLVPGGIAAVTEHLAAMCERLPELGQRVDRVDLQRLVRINGSVVSAKQAGHLPSQRRDERARCAIIARRHPELHDIETQGRRAHLAKQQRR